MFRYSSVRRKKGQTIALHSVRKIHANVRLTNPNLLHTFFKNNDYKQYAYRRVYKSYGCVFRRNKIRRYTN